MATHQGKFRSSAKVVEAVFSEGVRERDWPELREDLILQGYEFAIVSRKVLPTEAEAETVNRMLGEMIGWRYSAWELPLQLLDGLLAKAFSRDRMGLDVVVFRRLGDLWKEGVICSKTANRVNVALKWMPDVANYGSPDDSWDLAIRKPELGWEVCCCSPGWYGPSA